MPKTVMIDEFHVRLLVPSGLPDREYNAITRTVNGKRFRAELGRAVAAVLRRHSALRNVKLLLKG